MPGGFGGMPGGFGGIPGAENMPAMAAAMMQNLKIKLASLGLSGVEPQHAMIAVGLLYFGRQYITTAGALGAAGICYGGLVTRQGQEALEQIAARFSSLAGTVLQAQDPYSVGLKEAYRQGYEDGIAGLDPR